MSAKSTHVLDYLEGIVIFFFSNQLKWEHSVDLFGSTQQFNLTQVSFWNNGLDIVFSGEKINKFLTFTTLSIESGSF